MDRKKQLIKIIGENGNAELLTPLIDQVIHLEKQLNELEKLPFYKVNPDNPQQQKVLPVFKLYKEILQQYTNCLKLLAHESGKDNEDEESPLRKWIKERGLKNGSNGD